MTYGDWSRKIPPRIDIFAPRLSSQSSNFSFRKRADCWNGAWNREFGAWRRETNNVKSTTCSPSLALKHIPLPNMIFSLEYIFLPINFAKIFPLFYKTTKSLRFYSIEALLELKDWPSVCSLVTRPLLVKSSCALLFLLDYWNSSLWSYRNLFF